jgi:hypothetical protein
MIQTKTKTKVTKSAPLKGRPMGGRIGEFQDMIDKAKRGDRQAEADLKLERAKLKTFGEGPGAGASGAMPNPKKKMGGKVMKKAQSGGKFPDLSKDGKVTKKDILIGKGVLPKKAKSGAKVKKAMMGSSMMQAPMMQTPMMKKGGAVKKCKYGCK